MFPVQLAVSALVWAALVVLLVRRRGALLARAARIPRARRVGAALLLLAGSIVLLGLGMAALGTGGLTPRGLTWWAWPLITLVGGAFVALQTAALVPLVLNAVEPVTPRGARASDTQSPDRP